MQFTRYLFLLLFLTAACAEVPPDPQAIINRSIEIHGGKRFEASVIDFDFRGRHFTADRQGGQYSFALSYTDSTGDVRNVLTNDGLYGEINGERVEHSERMQRVLPGAINSIMYFAFLPYKLNDPAVQKRYLGESVMKGETFHKIEVTFEKEGGGADWNDIFIYWIHKEQYTMDYLAYFYHVNNGGTRFREAHNIRTIEGIRFADYRNYKAESDSISVDQYDRLFNEDALIKVSDVNLENVKVRLKE